MPGYLGGPQDRITEGEVTHNLLGEHPHGGLIGALLHHPVQGQLGGHPGISPITHQPQHGSGRSDLSLG